MRQVYPADIFERRKKYGVPVWYSRHEGLNQYIATFVSQFMIEFAKVGVPHGVPLCLTPLAGQD